MEKADQEKILELREKLEKLEAISKKEEEEEMEPREDKIYELLEKIIDAIRDADEEKTFAILFLMLLSRRLLYDKNLQEK